MALTKEEMKHLVAELVEEKLKEMLGDPDADAMLKEKAKKRLKASFDREEEGEPGIPAKTFARKLGMKW